MEWGRMREMRRKSGAFRIGQMKILTVIRGLELWILEIMLILDLQQIIRTITIRPLFLSIYLLLIIIPLKCITLLQCTFVYINLCRNKFLSTS